MGSWSANQDHGDWQAGSIYSLDMLDKGMTHAPGGMTQDSKRVHRNTQKCEQLKTYNFFLWNFSFKTLRLSLNSDSWNYKKKVLVCSPCLWHAFFFSFMGAQCLLYRVCLWFYFLDSYYFGSQADLELLGSSSAPCLSLLSS